MFVRTWAFTVFLVVVVAVVLDLDIARVLATNARFVGDFTVFWTAARIAPDQLYDAAAMTEAQRWIVGDGGGPRPFVNPPSALPWLVPFGWLPFQAALVAWVGLELGAYFAAARLLLRGWDLLLLAASPFVWISAATGQFSLLQGAAVIAAVAVLPRRPLLAGVLLGLAATVKPHTIVLAPVALIAAREWRALAAALVAGFAVGLACVALQGLELWLDWIEAARGFPELVRDAGLLASGITPASLPVPEAARPIVVGLGALLGVACVWTAFARSNDKAVRLVALAVGSLLASAYGRKYDAVMLQPAAVLLLLDRRRGPYGWIAGAAGLVAMSKAYIVIGVAVILLTPRVQRLGIPAEQPAPVASQA